MTDIHKPTAEAKTERDWAFRQHCVTDREPWPCRERLLADIAAIRAEADERVAALRGVLSSIEWHQQRANYEAECAGCLSFRSDGHATGCPVRAALDELRAAVRAEGLCGKT